MFLWAGRKVFVPTKDGYRRASIVEKLPHKRVKVASLKNSNVTWTVKREDVVLYWPSFWDFSFSADWP